MSPIQFSFPAQLEGAGVGAAVVGAAVVGPAVPPQALGAAMNNSI